MKVTCIVSLPLMALASKLSHSYSIQYRVTLVLRRSAHRGKNRSRFLPLGEHCLFQYCHVVLSNMNFESVMWKNGNSKLSLFFATLCIIDIFGVFPIITLPQSIVQCGLYGIPLVLIVIGLQIYTAILLGKSWTIATVLDPQISRKNRYPLAAVTELLLGQRARFIVTILLDLTVFGCGIPNLLVASQNLHLFGVKVLGQSFDLSFCYWLLIIGLLLCPLMWLGSPRDMKWIVTCSSVIVTLTAILTWWSITIDDRTFNVGPIASSPTWDKFISGYGMMAFQFDVHPTLMTIQVDMRHPQDIDKAIFFSFLASGSLFIITTCLAVWKYGGNTPANILEIVPSGPVANTAVLLAALQLCFSSVIGYSVLFQHRYVKLAFGWRRCAMRSAVVFLSVVVGESVSRFDIVMALIGGSLTGTLVFVLPPIIYIRALALKRSSSYVTTVKERNRSGSRTRLNDEEQYLMDSVHSRSIYYGLPSATNNFRSYTYLYFDDLDDEVSSHSEEFAATNCYEAKHAKNAVKNPIIKTLREEQPLLIDARLLHSNNWYSDHPVFDIRQHH